MVDRLRRCEARRNVLYEAQHAELRSGRVRR